jgi:hypothetical protein
MTRLTLLAGLAVLIAAPAIAGSPPGTIPSTSTDVAAACRDAGPGTVPFAGGGLTGCQNTVTGGAVACGTDGQCRDFFADPRYGKIKAILDASHKQQSPI